MAREQNVKPRLLERGGDTTARPRCCGSRFRLNQPARVGKAGLHVPHLQPGVRSEQIIKIRVVGQVRQNELDGNTCPLQHRLPDKDLGIDNDAIQVLRLFCCHRSLV